MDYSSLCQKLIEVTEAYWPDEDEGDHFAHRAFQEMPDDYMLMDAEQCGFCFLGCGNFTCVFSHGDAPGVVFKLNAGTLDRMREYHYWLMTQTHENLPRILHIEEHEEGCVAVGEELGCLVGDYMDVSFKLKKALASLIEDAGFRCDDTHPGNFMMRGYTPILNDPYSGRSDMMHSSCGGDEECEEGSCGCDYCC